MAKGKRDRRETIRSMTVDPDLFDAAIWQQFGPCPRADSGADVESAKTPTSRLNKRRRTLAMPPRRKRGHRQFDVPTRRRFFHLTATGLAPL